MEETVAILKGLKEKFEKHHHVRYTAAALEAAAALSKRYISDRFLPDKAIDVMDEAASRKKVGLFTMPDDLKKAEEEAKKFSQRKEEALMEGNIRRAKFNNTNSRRHRQRPRN